MQARVSQCQGLRSHMEDTYSIDRIDRTTVVGVYDGHGGSRVSQHLSSVFGRRLAALESPGSHSLRRAFLDADEDIVRVLPEGQGSTACVAVVRPCEVWFVNCGDSLACVGYRGGGVEMASYEHKVSNELARLRARGAEITYGDGTARIHGCLNVSRSFGDARWKRFVTAAPYVRAFKRASIEYAVLATDGVWDVMDAHDVDRIVRSRPRAAAATDILREARRRRSGDNMTAAVVYFVPDSVDVDSKARRGASADNNAERPRIQQSHSKYPKAKRISLCHTRPSERIRWPVPRRRRLPPPLP